MRRPAALVALAGAALVLALASHALAAQPVPKVGVADIEDEVMCPVCGTLLELAESPQAKREKVLVHRLIAEGKTRSEIKDELVAQYGENVLAVPSGSGFDLSAYLVPAIALAIAIVALAIGVARWRRQGRDGPPPSSRPRGEDDERLDADIARYDL
jgi:cytochrome c-type biogenesis protein CcmH